MQIATSGGRVIVNGNRIGTSCACCGPPNPCAACCPGGFPEEIQAAVNVSSIAEACYVGSGYRNDGPNRIAEDFWTRKAPWNQHGLASGSFTLSSTVLFFAGTEEQITSQTKCKSYTYGSGLVVADDETVVAFRIIATCFGNCVWQLRISFTQYIFPLFTPPAVPPDVGSLLFPGFRTDSLFNYSPEGLSALVQGGFLSRNRPHTAFVNELVSIDSPCLANATTASLTGTVGGYVCTPETGGIFSARTRCVRPVEGGVEAVGSGFPPSVSGPYDVSYLSGAGELTDTPCPAQTASISVTLTA